MYDKELIDTLEKQAEEIEKLRSEKYMLLGYLSVIYKDVHEYPILFDSEKMVNVIKKINKIMNLNMEV